MTAIRVISLAAACLAATPVFAFEQGKSRFNGFGTIGVTHLGGEDDGRGYGVSGQTTDSWRGDQLSKFGGQLTYGITDTVDLTLQATAKAYADKWKANLEWAYLSWQSTDNLMLRVGRLRTPMYMYSESIDVGFSYPWLRLPDEVYSQVQLSNYEGADLIYNLPLSIGSVALQVAAGQAKEREEHYFDENFDVDYSRIFGINASLATNDFGAFRVGYVEADIKTEIAGSFTDNFGNSNSATLLALDKDKGKFTSIGYQYDTGTWLTANEWTHLLIEGDGTGSTQAFYMMGGRRFGDFLAHVTYAQLDEDEGRQSSWTFGLNYNVLPTVVLKGEYKRVDSRGGYDGVFVRNAQELYDNSASNVSNGALGIPTRNYDGDIISAGVDFVF
ncbi:hypothetical protein NAV33_12830 [Pseudomonas stutzeri]|uniref:hypothetical protein n=1 Tax=Stutzerimonas stutzeri TaxID=316 RepID=UPI00210B9196|nr:hypothetical protein [Stutzerimonas stutzeri]MCQ4312777.1 hypothetical protein [Stutzerimonas stutzeri]